MREREIRSLRPGKGRCLHGHSSRHSSRAAAPQPRPPAQVRRRAHTAAFLNLNAGLPDILHFAWLIPLDDKGKLLLSTVYDGDFDIYLDKFIDSSHAAFDAVLPLVKDGPPTPVLQNRQAFHDFVRKNNISPIPGTFFSAYPKMNVSAIQNC